MSPETYGVAGGDNEGVGRAAESSTGTECRRRGFAASSRGVTGDENPEGSTNDVRFSAGVSPLDAVVV